MKIVNQDSETQASTFNQLVSPVDTQQLTLFTYGRQFAGCLIKTYDGRLLLQQRGDNWDRFPGMLATFGGQVDADETQEEGMARELREELGAELSVGELVFLGAFTKVGLDDALIHAYWWHDKEGSISGCYEGEPTYFNDAVEILSKDTITPDVFWIVNRCLEQGLLS